jgi:hypothetical protein
VSRDRAAKLTGRGIGDIIAKSSSSGGCSRSASRTSDSANTPTTVGGHQTVHLLPIDSAGIELTEIRVAALLPVLEQVEI